MYSSLIGKIEKAIRYAEERDRVRLKQLSATFRGDHNEYNVEYQEGRWACACPFFAGHDTCSHTMALQRMLEGMVPADLPVQG